MVNGERAHVATHSTFRQVAAMNSPRRDWPAVSHQETYSILTAPGAPFEMETLDIAGRPVRVYKKAHRDLRSIFEASKLWGDRTYIVFGNERVSFRGHYRAASALAWRLVDDPPKRAINFPVLLSNSWTQACEASVTSNRPSLAKTIS